MTNENSGTVLKVKISTKGDRRKPFLGNRTENCGMLAGISTDEIS